MPTTQAGITFYGGVNEIGGNKILIEDRGTRVMLDFGMSYSDRRKFFFDPMLSPGDERDLLEFGILPTIKGIYEFEDSKPSIDAVVLSHCARRPLGIHILPEEEHSNLLRRDLRTDTESCISFKGPPLRIRHAAE